MSALNESTCTMRTALEHSFKTNGEQRCIGRIVSPDNIAWLSYAQVAERIKPLASIFEALYGQHEQGNEPQFATRPFLAIAGDNSVEWLVADWAASGIFVPTAGLHPEWPAAKIRRALELTRAHVVVATSVASLQTVLTAMTLVAPAPTDAAAASATAPPLSQVYVKHIFLLDPALDAAGAAQVALDAEAQLRAPETTPDSPKVCVWPTSKIDDTNLDQGTVSPASLRELESRVCSALGVKLEGSTSLFPPPTAAWLSATSTRLQQQSEGANGPLFRPLATPRAVAMAAGRGIASATRTAADWVVAAEAGQHEASIDIAGIWAVLFSSGSSGQFLKGTPISRAGWASSNGAWGGSALPPGVDNNIALSHSALSHGLDRGACWRAVLAGGCIGMARSHDHAAIVEAISAFRPAVFVTMPSFWTRLYVDSIAHTATRLQAQLCESLGPDSTSATPARGARDAIVSLLVTEQLRGATQLLMDTREHVASWPQEGPRRRRYPDGLLSHAWLGRPHGSLAAVLQEISVELQAQISLPSNSVKMGSGGAGVSLDVLTFLNWTVFNGRFSDFYGATEAPGIAEGMGWLSVASSAQVRLGLGGTPVAEELRGTPTYAETTSVMVGELEVATAGGARRYFGADDGDTDAVAASGAAFAEDGWWRSGDLVELGMRGTQQVLRVLGRAADQVELYHNGDSVWISAAELAAAYASAPVVHAGQLVVEGKRDDAFLVGVLVPSAAWVATTCTLLAASGRLPFPIFTSAPGLANSSEGLDPSSEAHHAARYQSACMQRIIGDTREAVTLRHLLAGEALKELRLHGQRIGLPSVQLLSGVIIDPVEWTASAGTSGAVHKTVRRAVLQLHRAELEIAFEKIKLKLTASTAATAATAGPRRTGLTRMASVPVPDTAAAQSSLTSTPSTTTDAPLIVTSAASPHAQPHVSTSEASPAHSHLPRGTSVSLSRSTSQQPDLLRTWSSTAPAAEAPTTPTTPKGLTPHALLLSPCDTAVDAGKNALLFSLSYAETPLQACRAALQAAWKSLVTVLLDAYQRAAGTHTPSSTMAFSATHAALIGGSTGSGSAASPWVGLLADLWCLVRARVVTACQEVGITAAECDGMLTSLSTPVYGPGCLVSARSSKTPRLVSTCDIPGLASALSTQGLCAAPLTTASLHLSVTHLDVVDPTQSSVVTHAETSRLVEHSDGDVVIACLRVENAHAFALLNDRVTQQHCLSALRLAASAYGAPVAAWPVALVLLPLSSPHLSSLSRTPTDVTTGSPSLLTPTPARTPSLTSPTTTVAAVTYASSTTPTPMIGSSPLPQVAAPVSSSSHAYQEPQSIEAMAARAARDFAENMSRAMLPTDLRDPARIFTWSVPPLPTPADARAVQGALDAARAVSREYWAAVARDGNEASRLAARELIRDDLEAAFDAAERTVVDQATAAADALMRAAASPFENEALVLQASEQFHALVHSTLPAALRQVGENLEIQAKLEQASLSSIPSIGAAAARHNAAVVHLLAAAVGVGLALPWQVRTLDFSPPVDAAAVSRSGDKEVGSLVFSAIPPVECCVTGRPLWHAGLANDDAFPYAAVNMEVGLASNPTAMTLSIYQALTKVAHALRRVRLSIAGAPDTIVCRAVAAVGMALHQLNPTIAEGGMFTVERDFHWRAAFPFGWEASTLTTLTPTPAAWIDAALRTWGPRPCLGTPLEKANESLLAGLPDHSLFDLSPVLTAPQASASAASESVDKQVSQSLVPSSETSPTHSPLLFTVSHGFCWLSYAQLSPLVRTLARTLRGLPGVARGGIVGICAENSPEWLLTDWAVTLAGMCPVGFHVTYTPEELTDAVTRVQPAVAVIAPDKLSTWLSMLTRGLLPSLRALVVLERDTVFASSGAQVRARAAVGDAPVLVESFQTLLSPTNAYYDTPGAIAWSQEDLRTLKPGRPDNLFTLLFTSGSSGRPKGVIISAETWRRDIGDFPPACRSFAWPFVNPSFIPLSHSSDRVRCWDTLGRGGRVGFCYYGAENWIDHQTGKKEAALRENTLTFSSNHVETLVLHLAALRPTALALPPRIWNGLKWLWDHANTSSTDTVTSVGVMETHACGSVTGDQSPAVSERTLGREESSTSLLPPSKLARLDSDAVPSPITPIARAFSCLHPATQHPSDQTTLPAPAAEGSPQPRATRRLTRAISLATSSGVPGIALTMSAFTSSTGRALMLLKQAMRAQHTAGETRGQLRRLLDETTFKMAADLFHNALSLDDVFGKRVLVIATGGAAPNSAVMVWAQSHFPERTYQESYGATECGAITESGLPMPACSGRALTIRLEPVSGFPFPQYGEMTVKTPTMAVGYWHDEAATRAAFTADGFWRTGDLVEARPGGKFGVIDRIGALVLVASNAHVTVGPDAKPGVLKSVMQEQEQKGAHGSETFLVSPAQVDAALLAAAAAAPLPAGLAVEHLCCVGVQQSLVVAVCLGRVGSEASAGAGSIKEQPSDNHDITETTVVVVPGPQQGEDDSRLALGAALLAWVHSVAGAAGLQAWETPRALVIVPQSLWVSAPGGLLNIQHKVARSQVRVYVESVLA
eukprot:m.84793 g.84793  ORF g.84793 m.84793 type:complete len:2558 (+) comp13489_c0_seq1:97-7770(+)